MTSTIYSVNIKDLAKGVFVAVTATVLTSLLAVLQSPSFDFATIDWAEIGKIALTTGVSYLIKQYFTDGEGRLLGAV
jgi:hypothetical protein